MDSKETKRPTISQRAIQWGRTVPAATDSPIFKAGWAIGGDGDAESRPPTAPATVLRSAVQPQANRADDDRGPDA